MNKFVIAVFKLVAVLVIIFICWQLIFNDGGILKTSYNSIATGINRDWAKTSGEGEEILPKWDEAVEQNNSNAWSGGFDIEVD